MASSSLHALLGFCLGLASLHLVFVALPAVGDLQGQGPAARGAQELPKIEADSPASAAMRFGGGVVLGLVLLAAGKPAMADVEDVVIPAPRQIWLLHSDPSTAGSVMSRWHGVVWFVVRAAGPRHMR